MFNDEILLGCFPIAGRGPTQCVCVVDFAASVFRPSMHVRRRPHRDQTMHFLLQPFRGEDDPTNSPSRFDDNRFIRRGCPLLRKIFKQIAVLLLLFFLPFFFLPPRNKQTLSSIKERTLIPIEL